MPEACQPNSPQVSTDLQFWILLLPLPCPRSCEIHLPPVSPLQRGSAEPLLLKGEEEEWLQEQQIPPEQLERAAVLQLPIPPREMRRRQMCFLPLKILTDLAGCGWGGMCSQAGPGHWESHVKVIQLVSPFPMLRFSN